MTKSQYDEIPAMQPPPGGFPRKAIPGLIAVWVATVSWDGKPRALAGCLTALLSAAIITSFLALMLAAAASC